MIHSDEREMAKEALEHGSFSHRYTEDCYNYEPFHYKRFHYILLKWSDKGWWDYGVQERGGWLTDEGREALRELI